MRCLVALSLLCLATVSLSGCGGARSDPTSREAAEWVLNAGGTLVLAGKTLRIKSVPELPKEDFGIEQIDRKKTDVDDEGLKHLAELTNLKFLQLYQLRITDKGIDHLKGLETLTELELSYTLITDEGLKKLASLRNLQKLFLYGTAVTDEGIESLTAQLSDCRVLR